MPPLGTLDFRDTQLFFKRLRKAISPHKIRYAGCEEYGPSTLRPHAHDLIFNFWPEDAQRTGRYFSSELLTRCWGKGHVVVAPVGPERIGYVMTHHVDKLTGDEADRVYVRRDPASGLLVRLASPKFYCSRRPGIGAPFLARFLSDVANPANRGILLDGVDVPLGRYFDGKLRALAPSVAVERDAARALDSLAPEFVWDNTPERLEVRRQCFVARMRQSRERREGGL